MEEMEEGGEDMYKGGAEEEEWGLGGGCCWH